MQHIDPQPCHSLPPGGFLMQQIVASGQVYLRYQRFSLCLTDLPCGMDQAQLQAVSVDPCGVRVERRCDCCRGSIPVTLILPLCCQLWDGCRQASASARIEVPMQLRPCGDPRETDRARPFANACARLVRACGCCEGDRVDAWLDVWAQAWLTACRPMYGGGCPPPCPPPLPLYPQPCRMR